MLHFFGGKMNVEWNILMFNKTLLFFRLQQNGKSRNIDLRNFNLDDLVEEKMYIKPSGELQLANGWGINDKHIFSYSISWLSSISICFKEQVFRAIEIGWPIFRFSWSNLFYTNLSTK